MTNQEAIKVLNTEMSCIMKNDRTHCDRKCESCELVFPLSVQEFLDAYNMAISALQAQDSKTRKICKTCKHDPPSKKWPCIDCDMREPADRWESARTFVELVVEYPDPELCTYKEYKGKPYYSIKYIENGETHVGYGTYNPEVLSQFLKEYFIPFAQPEIVRCGQCKYAEVADAQDNQDGYTCQFHRGSIWFSGSYCSWGKERTDGRD